MLAEKTKKDVKELTAILTRLDNVGRTLMLSNAMVLLARQEVFENKEKLRDNKEHG